MKKALFVIFLVLLFFRVDIFGSEYDGINYFDPSLFSIEISEIDNGCRITFEMNEPLKIKDRIEYFILPTFINKENFQRTDITWEMMPQVVDNVQIREYMRGEYFNRVYLRQKLCSNGRVVGYRYMVNPLIDEIIFDNLIFETQDISKNEFLDIFENECGGQIDCFLLMIEAARINELPTAKDFQYEWVLDEYTDISDLKLGEDLSLFAYGNSFPQDLSPILDSEQYFVETSVDNPLSIAELKDLVGLTAWDEVDGDITHKIIIIDDSNYTSEIVNCEKIKDRRLDIYSICFAVTDSAGNSTSCIINIEVKDFTPPYLDKNNSILSYITRFDDEPLTITEMINNIIAIDNYGDVTISVLENEYQGNERILGTYYLTFRCMDPSGNYLDVEVEIINQDQTPPLITASTTIYETSYTSNLDIEAIFEEINLMINDNYDGILDYEIIVNDYDNNKNNVGKYQITIKATDSSGNESTFTITVNVIDDVNPQFLINKNRVIVKAGHLVDYQEIKRILEIRKLIKDKNYELEIINDDYTDNYDRPGEYIIELQINYEDGTVEYQKLTFNVITNKAKNEKISFWKKIWQIIKIIFQILWNIISWPFIKLFSLF